MKCWRLQLASMKRLLFACILCLGLTATSVWLISNPVLAGSATANPLADTTTKAFHQLALKDRSGAQSLADTFQSKEFRIAATLGIYNSLQK